MKRAILTGILTLIILFAGEVYSDDKTIIGQEYGNNVWQVNHFFNLYSTTMLAPINDTVNVKIIEKNHIGNQYKTMTSDGTRIITLTTKQSYDYVDVNDSVKLVTTFEPSDINIHGCRKRYTLIK